MGAQHERKDDSDGQSHWWNGFHKPEEETGGAKLNGPSVGGHAGVWKDEDGVTHRGVKAGVSLARGQLEGESGGNTWDLDVEGPGAEAGIDNANGKTKTSAEANLVKARAGFASHNAKSDHDRGFHFGLKVGEEREFGGEGEENEKDKGKGLPLHFGTTDKDEDGNPEYHFGGEMEVLPGVTISADYETETPVSDVVSSNLLGPLGVPINWGMHALGLGDYAPGTLLHNGAGLVHDKIFGGDEKASPLEEAQRHRETQRLSETFARSGMKPEQAAAAAGAMDPAFQEARETDQASSSTYGSLTNMGLAPEAAESVASVGNPAWRQLRELDRASSTTYESLLKSGLPPEAAARIAQSGNAGWRPPEGSAKPATRRAAPDPVPGPVCRAGGDPFRTTRIEAALFRGTEDSNEDEDQRDLAWVDLLPCSGRRMRRLRFHRGGDEFPRGGPAGAVDDPLVRRR